MMHRFKTQEKMILKAQGGVEIISSDEYKHSTLGHRLNI